MKKCRIRICAVKLILLFGVASCSVGALTYREVGARSWKIVDELFPDRNARNALALYGYYDREIRNNLISAEGQVASERIAGLWEIIRAMGDLCLTKNSLSDSQMNQLVHGLSNELARIGSEVVVLQMDCQFWMDLNMLMLLLDFIEKAKTVSRDFDKYFIKRCTEFGSWDPVPQVQELLKRDFPDDVFEAAKMNYFIVACRVSLDMFGIQTPASYQLFEDQEIDARQFLAQVPKCPNF
jgi:hypothetical protein